MNARPAKILLVDDAAGSRVIAQILSGSDRPFKFSLEVASNGADAMERLRRRRFDGIVVNSAVEEQPIEQTVEEMHVLCPDVPVIVLKTAGDSRSASGSLATADLAQRLSQAIADSRAMRALKQTCKTFKSILHYAPEAIICTTPAGRILQFNAAARRLWDCRRGDVIGKNFLDRCFAPEDRRRLYAAMQKISHGQPVADIRSVLHRNGADMTLVWRFSSIYGNGSAVPVIIAAAHEAAHQTENDNTNENSHVAFKPEFNDTVDLVLSSLCAIIERIERINDATTPQVLDRLRKSYSHLPATARQIPADKARAVERLVLSLIAQGQKQAS